MPSRGQWVFDPDSGGIRIPDAVKRRTEQRLRRYAEQHFAGRYTRIDIRFRGQFCYIDAYTEPRLSPGWPPPDFPEPIAEAATAMAGDASPELPSVAGPCLFLRRAALRELGGLDPVSFPGLGVLDDFARRAAAMGWSNLLCTSAFVVNLPASADGQAPVDEPGRLQSRWPDYQEQLARFILADPLRELRHRLQARMDLLAASGPQRDLFN